MRPRQLAGALVCAVVAMAGAVVLAHSGAEPEAAPAGVEYRHEQDEAGVRVIVRNPSSSWTLRGQAVVITMFSSRGRPVRTYGPTGRYRRSTSDPLARSRPHDAVECCLLPDLPPGGQHVFRLWRIPDVAVHRVVVEPWGSAPVWRPTRGTTR